MVSLGQSILIQRLNKVNAAVNAKILAGLASLALISAPSDFKSILDTYNMMGAEAVWQDDQSIVNAVGAPLPIPCFYIDSCNFTLTPYL